VFIAEVHPRQISTRS